MNRHEIITNNCIQTAKLILNSMLDAMSFPKQNLLLSPSTAHLSVQPNCIIFIIIYRLWDIHSVRIIALYQDKLKYLKCHVANNDIIMKFMFSLKVRPNDRNENVLCSFKSFVFFLIK